MSETDLPDDVRRSLGDVPVFPLPHAVLFPGAMLPLHVFEPRYRAMLAYCLANHRAMVVARLTDESEAEGPGRPRFAPVAGLGIIVEHRALRDGRANIVLQGHARVAVEERASDDPFRRVRCAVLDDYPSAVTPADRAALLSAATGLVSSLDQGELELSFPQGASTARIADLCAQHLVFDSVARQAVLEERDVAARVRKVTAELALQQFARRPGAGSSRSDLN